MDFEEDLPDDSTVRIPESEGCALCGRNQPLTFHHLIPKAVHRKGRFQRQHTKAEMRTRGLWVCRLCHHGIHDLIPDEKELGAAYNTAEALRGHPGLARHVAWVKKQK